MNRRDMLKTGLMATVATGALPLAARAADKSCPTDGTPAQFVPKNPKDADPATDDLKKYPKCPYCGMDRTKWNHSRHLVQYSNDVADGTCSIHCLALSLALNIDAEPVMIWAADFGADSEIKPLVEVNEATYLVGSSLPGTMTDNSKMAFADKAIADKVMDEKGGKTMGFHDALEVAYNGMWKNTVRTRKRRAERMKRQGDKGTTHGN